MKILFSKSNEQLITLERVKLAAKITGTDRDEEVKDALNAAIEYAQVFLGAPVAKCSVKLITDCWPGSYCIPFEFVSIDSVTVDGEAGDYSLSGHIIAIDAVGGPVQIELTGGYTAENLPSPIKQAVLMLATDYLRNQQAQQGSQLYKNTAVDDLLALYRSRLFL